MDVIPERALKMCTWQELEVLVCGDPHIDVEVMRANTTYQGFGGESDRACQYFWRVMRSLPDVQRSEFVRFAWGRCVFDVINVKSSFVIHLHLRCEQVAFAEGQVGAAVQAHEEVRW